MERDYKMKSRVALPCPLRVRRTWRMWQGRFWAGFEKRAETEKIIVDKKVQNVR